MITKSEFRKRIQDMPISIPSKTGKASYTKFRIKEDILSFRRVNPKTDWELNWEKLYGIYCTNSYLNTSVIKKITGGRVNSPSIAILEVINCIDKKGNRI